jgi:hypothetical protein
MDSNRRFSALAGKLAGGTTGGADGAVRNISVGLPVGEDEADAGTNRNVPGVWLSAAGWIDSFEVDCGAPCGADKTFGPVSKMSRPTSCFTVVEGFSPCWAAAETNGLVTQVAATKSAMVPT